MNYRIGMIATVEDRGPEYRSYSEAFDAAVKMAKMTSSVWAIVPLDAPTHRIATFYGDRAFEEVAPF